MDTAGGSGTVTFLPLGINKFKLILFHSSLVLYLLKPNINMLIFEFMMGNISTTFLKFIIVNAVTVDRTDKSSVLH